MPSTGFSMICEPRTSIDDGRLIPLTELFPKAFDSIIEKGKRYYSFVQCKHIALALNTSMDYLAGLTDEKQPYPRNAEYIF